MKKYSVILILIMLTMSTLLSCDNSNDKSVIDRQNGEEGWTLKGNIDGSDSTIVYLERLNDNGWFILDSVLVDNDGDFRFSYPKVGYPEVFRLKSNDNIVYFPVDSIETIIYKGFASAIDSAYTLSGSTSAEMMMTIDNKIATLVREKGEAAVANDSILKRELSGMILGDEVGLVSYYIVNKRVGNTLIFDPANKRDVRIIGAVANKFDLKRPNDPRAQYLKKLFLENRRVSSIDNEKTFEVSQTSLFDIKLYDNKGKMQSLKDVASKGKVTILNFTIYGAEGSPAYNVELNKIYEANKDKLEIYQVSVDNDQITWSESAENLPWITVFAHQNERATPISNYNVNLIPVSYIINRNGELVERVDDVTQLEKAIKKYL